MILRSHVLRPKTAPQNPMWHSAKILRWFAKTTLLPVVMPCDFRSCRVVGPQATASDDSFSLYVWLKKWNSYIFTYGTPYLTLPKAMWGGRVKVIKTRLEGCHSPLARTTVWQRVLVLIYSKVKLSEAMRTYESTSQGFELWCLWSQAFGGIPMVSYIQLIGYLIDPTTTSNIWIF